MKTILIDDYCIFCNLKRGKGGKIEFQNNNENQKKIKKFIHFSYIHVLKLFLFALIFFDVKKIGIDQTSNNKD